MFSNCDSRGYRHVLSGTERCLTSANAICVTAALGQRCYYAAVLRDDAKQKGLNIGPRVTVQMSSRRPTAGISHARDRLGTPAH